MPGLLGKYIILGRCKNQRLWRRCNVLHAPDVDRDKSLEKVQVYILDYRRERRDGDKSAIYSIELVFCHRAKCLHTTRRAEHFPGAFADKRFRRGTTTQIFCSCLFLARIVVGSTARCACERPHASRSGDPLQITCIFRHCCNLTKCWKSDMPLTVVVGKRAKPCGHLESAGVTTKDNGRGFKKVFFFENSLTTKPAMKYNVGAHRSMQSRLAHLRSGRWQVGGF